MLSGVFGALPHGLVRAQAMSEPDLEEDPEIQALYAELARKQREAEQLRLEAEAKVRAVCSARARFPVRRIVAAVAYAIACRMPALQRHTVLCTSSFRARLRLVNPPDSHRS
jgi:hypothetical protein